MGIDSLFGFLLAIEMPIQRLSALKWACPYATELGWPVLPVFEVDGSSRACEERSSCGDAGKHVRGDLTVADASRDHRRIEGWWDQWPTANVGVATGPIGGIVVVDIDGPTGERALRARFGRSFDRPLVPSVRTGRGRHLYFRYPRDITIGTRMRDADGDRLERIDVGGLGGWVVVPPSLHCTGRIYRWSRGRSPFHGVELAPFPVQLYKYAAERMTL